MLLNRIFWLHILTLIIWLDMCDGTFFLCLSIQMKCSKTDHISREICQNIKIYTINNKIYTHDDDVAGSNWITHRLQGLLRLLWAAIRSRERERRKKKKKKIKNITNRRWRSPGTWHIHLLIMLFAIGLSAYYYYYL